MRTSVKVAGGLFAALVAMSTLSGCQRADRPMSATGGGAATPASVSRTVTTSEPAAAPTSSAVGAPERTAPAPSPTRGGGAAASPLLFAAPGGDGDSWKDTRGREYRLGLVNTPEYDQCYGAKATARRKALVANGFRAQVYQTDTYGRAVSVVTLADGRNLNVWLARNGYADDRYLDRFRSENPSLAAQLDQAFAAAKAARLGLWGACSGGSSPAPQPVAAAPTSSSCHPAYRTCIPVKGDGSGNGAANDLDCGDLREVVQLRQAGDDPYRLDSNGDGVGCESYG